MLIGYNLGEAADELPEVHVGLIEELVNAESDRNDGQVNVGDQGCAQIRQLA